MARQIIGHGIDQPPSEGWPAISSRFKTN